jgi:hypothetical protein
MRTLRLRAALVTSAAAALMVCGVASGATLPIGYQLQLQVRADTGGTAFNLPNGSTFNSVSPSLNDAGNVAVKVNTIGAGTTQGLWFGGHGTGSAVYNSGNSNAILSDPYLNNNNIASFPISNVGPALDGVYLYTNSTGTTSRVTTGPLGATGWGNPQVNDNGIIGIRSKFSSPQTYTSYDPASNTFATHASETAADSSSPYSFLYTNWINNNRQIAGKVGLTTSTNPLEIRIFNANGSSTLIASADTSTGPTFFAFDNTVTLNNDGKVAFVARTTTASSSRRIFVGDGTTTTPYPAVAAANGFTSLDSFPAVINDAGQVVFRGNDNQATPRDSVFITDGTIVQRIAGVGDTLQTDTGPRIIGSLMGSPDINNLGEVAFGVQFTSATGGGNAIYVAYVPEPGTLALIAVGAGALLMRRRSRW